MAAFCVRLEPPTQQHDNLRTSLREIQPPTRTEVNPKLGNAFADGLDVTHQAALHALMRATTTPRTVGSASSPSRRPNATTERQQGISAGR